MPLSLNDVEYNAVQAAAAPIHPLQRDAFLKALGSSWSAIPSLALASCTAWLQSFRRPSAWWRTVKRCSPPRRGRARWGAEPGPGSPSPPAGRSQLLEPLALCNARLDRQLSGRET